jgi:hypothetical protein
MRRNLVREVPKSYSRYVETALNYLCGTSSWIGGHAYFIICGIAKELRVDWHVKIPEARARLDPRLVQ